MKIHYATGNFGKYEEATLILASHELHQRGWQVIHTPLHLEEIQGSSQQIASHKVRQAYTILNEPCMIDDVAIYCHAIGGLPGPYIRPFLEAIGDAGLWTLISHYDDHRCTVSCLIAFLQEATQEPLVFEGSIAATIVAPRGTRKTAPVSWTAIVQPEGSAHTFAEMTLEEASLSSARNKALSAFRNYLLTHPASISRKSS